ncbi:hypothetical protein EC412_23765 [Salmonella enterica subsp. enterica serovar Redlands]|nr:hypothetical protein [Salmonella enterica subsp. enterica serovar Redlands]
MTSTRRTNEPNAPQYDGRGLLITEENRAGKHEHEYDPLGNLLET